jgi:hypothetical protein
VVAAALDAVGLSAFDADPAKYLSFLARPLDLASSSAYYRSPGLSTCALTVLAAWRLAGCTDLECTAPYYPGRVGRAFVDVQVLAGRYGAWEHGRQAPLKAGDAWVIVDGHGGDGHMGLAVGDEQPDGTVATVEGGQLDPRGGSTAIGAFTRRLVGQGAGSGRVYLMGQRHIFGVVRTQNLPIPDDFVAT